MPAGVQIARQVELVRSVWLGMTVNYGNTAECPGRDLLAGPLASDDVLGPAVCSRMNIRNITLVLALRRL